MVGAIFSPVYEILDIKSITLIQYDHVMPIRIIIYDQIENIFFLLLKRYL